VNTGLDDLIVAVAAGGLPGSLREFPEDPVPEPQALELVRATERLGLVGFLLASIRNGRLALPPVAVEALDEAQLYETTTRLYLEQELLPIGMLLDEADIEFRVLDGCAVAHLDYRDSDVRAVTRLDLLVHPRDLGRAAQVLRRRGWRPPRDTESHAGRGVPLVGPSGPRLVLHDTLDASPESNVDLHELWADADPFVLSGRRLKALGSEQRLLHVSTLAHGPDDQLTLLPHRDLAEMVLFGQWRRGRLMELASSWSLQRVLADAVDTAWRRLAIADVTRLSVWAQAYHAEPRPHTRRRAAGGSEEGVRGWYWARPRARLSPRP
jgi:hypothetical protein